MTERISLKEICFEKHSIRAPPFSRTNTNFSLFYRLIFQPVASLDWEQTVKHCSSNIVTFHVWNRCWTVCGVKNRDFSTKKMFEAMFEQVHNLFKQMKSFYWPNQNWRYKRRRHIARNNVWRISANHQTRNFKCLKNYVLQFAPSFTSRQNFFS